MCFNVVQLLNATKISIRIGYGILLNYKTHLKVLDMGLYQVRLGSHNDSSTHCIQVGVVKLVVSLGELIRWFQGG